MPASSPPFSIHDRTKHPESGFVERALLELQRPAGWVCGSSAALRFTSRNRVCKRNLSRDGSIHVSPHPKTDMPSPDQRSMWAVGM